MSCPMVAQPHALSLLLTSVQSCHSGVDAPKAQTGPGTARDTGEAEAILPKAAE
jgi:hypothetical protein